MAKKNAMEIAVTKGDARAMLADETYNEAPVNSMEPECITQNLKYCGCHYNNKTTLPNGKVDGANINLHFEVVSGARKGARFNVKAYLLKVTDGQKDGYTKERIRELCNVLGAKPTALDDESLLGKIINAQVAVDIDVKTQKPKVYNGRTLYKVFNIRAPITMKTPTVEAEIAN